MPKGEGCLVECPNCGSLLRVHRGKAEEVEWWELLDWDTMPKTFAMLPERLKHEILKRKGTDKKS